MVLVDTSVWIEFFRGHQPFFDQIGELIDHQEIVAISAVFGELLQGARDNRELSVITELWNSLRKLDVSGLAVKVGTLSGRSRWVQMGVGLIDAMVLVAARETSSFVWTLDKKLLQLLRKEERYVR